MGFNVVLCCVLDCCGGNKDTMPIQRIDRKIPESTKLVSNDVELHERMVSKQEPK